MSQSSGGRPSARLGVVLAGARDARTLAAISRAALDRPLRAAAELSLAVASDDAVLAGAFQRVAGSRRGSGGPEVRVGPGTVHVALALANPAALVPCDEKHIVNRCVRPLLRALTKAGGTGAPAHFFGRDWISLAHRPVAWVGFAHDATTRRTLFEAFVAVRVPFALGDRASFLGKPQVTLEALAGAPVDETRLLHAIADAYAGNSGSIPLDPAPLCHPEAEGRTTPLPDPDPTPDPPWAATVDEVIGPLGAGPDAHGVFRVGGDLLVSRDALARLETLAATAPLDALGRIVDETLAAPGVALDGVRSLTSVRDVIAAARRA
ncbi:MAG TPA: hypothetical protein VGL81_20645 [Polyangiaceae bacterium]|jgi:hypothetical protein